MTLQEKINKLPLSIPYWDELDYELRIEATKKEKVIYKQNKWQEPPTPKAEMI